MTQHAALTEDRWSRFNLDQQVLMIANEMNRTARVIAEDNPDSRRRGYERILRLTDLTIGLNARPALRRELLRWRDLVAALYVAEGASVAQHRLAFRARLQLRPLAARQIALLLR